MTPRRIVLAYAMVTVLGWVLAVGRLSDLPPPPYVVIDVAFDVAVVVGLLSLWRPAWIAAVALTAVGELFVALHPVTGAVLLVVGAVQLALLLLPPLRESLRRRPRVASH